MARQLKMSTIKLAPLGYLNREREGLDAFDEWCAFVAVEFRWDIGKWNPALVSTDSFLAITMAKVTRKKARHDKTIMMAISHDNFSAVEPVSDHSLSLEMHLKIQYFSIKRNVFVSAHATSQTFKIALISPILA